MGRRLGAHIRFWWRKILAGTAAPLQAAWVLYPLFVEWLGQLRRNGSGAFRYCVAQYAVWLGSWALLLALDWRRALLFVIVPQLHGLH